MRPKRHFGRCSEMLQELSQDQQLNTRLMTSKYSFKILLLNQPTNLLWEMKPLHPSVTWKHEK